jgi:hypothetical protein
MIFLSFALSIYADVDLLHPMFRVTTPRRSRPMLGFGTAHAGLRLSMREAVYLYETAFRSGITRLSSRANAKRKYS